MPKVIRLRQPKAIDEGHANISLMMRRRSLSSMWVGKVLNLAQQERLSALTSNDQICTLYIHIQIYNITLFLMINR